MTKMSLADVFIKVCEQANYEVKKTIEPYKTTYQTLTENGRLLVYISYRRKGAGINYAILELDPGHKLETRSARELAYAIATNFNYMIRHPI